MNGPNIQFDNSQSSPNQDLTNSLNKNSRLTHNSSVFQRSPPLLSSQRKQVEITMRDFQMPPSGRQSLEGLRSSFGRFGIEGKQMNQYSHLKESFSVSRSPDVRDGYQGSQPFERVNLNSRHNESSNFGRPIIQTGNEMG